MFLVADCILKQHDLLLVLLAALICSVSAAAGLGALDQAGRANTGSGQGWLAMAAIITGAGAWTTHFVAVLAYAPGVPFHFDLWTTAWSLAIAPVGPWIGFGLALRDRRLAPWGGAVVAIGVACMHYVGVHAVHGLAYVHWRSAYAGAAVLMSTGFAALALRVHRGAPRRQGWAVATGLLVLSVCSLHFTAMSAVAASPSLALDDGDRGLDRPLLALVVGGVGLSCLIVGVAFTAWEARRRLSYLESLRLAFQCVPSGVAFFNPAGRLVLWNAMYGELMSSFNAPPVYGCLRSELMANAMKNNDTPAEYHDLLMSAPASGRSYERKTPEGRWIRVESRAMADASVVTVISDVTAPRRAAEAMAEARDKAEAADRAKSDFLANMSHELRTPLNGLLGMLQVMEQHPLAEAQRERVRIAHRSGLELLDVLSDILDLSHLQAGRNALVLNPVDVVAVAQATICAFQSAAAVKGLALELVAPPGARGTWMADAPKLRQATFNLVSNAIKFTASGSVTLELEPSAGGLAVHVKDTGIGLDTEDFDQLRQAFAQADTTKTRATAGAGLGLSICHNLASVMGGRLTVVSTRGQGACFSLHLPLSRSETATAVPGIEPAPCVGPMTPAEAADAARDRASNEASPLRILVAEDNPTNRMVLQALLEPLDCAVVMSEDGQEALDQFSGHAFDAVLMDIQMPKMNGIESARQMRSLERLSGAPATPIIAVTANVMPDQVAEYLGVGMNGCVSKPIQAGALYAALENAIAERPSVASADRAA